MHIVSDQQTVMSQAVTVQLEEQEAVYVLHPQQIVSFQGQSEQREDHFMDIAGMYRKRKFIQSRIAGPASFLLGLPAGFCIQMLPITEGTDLLFEWKHILFYTEGMKVERRIQTLKNAVITRELVKMKFSSPDGVLGIVSNGPLHIMELHPDKPTYVDVGCLVAYPENAVLKPRVYGNTLASQYMNYHWEIMGRGYVLLQTGKSDAQFAKDLEGDGIVKRVLREVIPFGNVIIK